LGVRSRLEVIHHVLAKPFHRDGYVYEEKYDGWRMVAYKDGRRVRLLSRRGVDHTARFPEIAKAIAHLPARTLILDGEVCVFDEGLVSHMHLLMEPPEDTLVTPPVFMALDCLYKRGGTTSGRGLSATGARSWRTRSTAQRSCWRAAFGTTALRPGRW